MADYTQDADTQDTSPAVNVTTNALSPAKPLGLTPLQAGLLYGGAAATVMGPLGALVGLGVGIASKIQRDNLIDHRAKQVADVVSETQGLQSQALSMMEGADPATQKFLREQIRLGNEGMTQFINENDPAGRAKMQNANISLAGVLSAQMQQARDSATAQETAKRTLVTNSAEQYRTQFQANQDAFRAVDTQADKILNLTSQPGFDPNKSVNKGLIIGMLTTGIGLYRDNPADTTDAIAQGVSGLNAFGAPGQVVAGAIQGGATYFKGKKFELSTDDYVRLAMNMKNYNAKATQGKMDQLSQQGQFLDAQARKWGVFDDKTDLAGYISGGVKKLPMTTPPEQPPAPTASQLLPSTSQSPRPAQVMGRGPTPLMIGPKWLQQQTAAGASNNNLAAGLSEGTPRPVN